MLENKIKIKTSTGQIVDAQAPVIISASRSTDIPAFYSKWLVNRLNTGYVIWINPFNQQPIYISFKNTKVIVFWSKNPSPIIPYLNTLDVLGIHYYFQFTLNDYESENLEKNIPPLANRIETFCQLSKLIGAEKVIWRFDPLIITPQTSVRDLLGKIWRIGNLIKGFTEKLVFSFIDVAAYRKVQSNLLKETNFYTQKTIKDAELSKDQIYEFINGIIKIRERWHTDGWNIKFATCAEDIDLSYFDIEHNSCIDGNLIRRLFNKDNDLMYFLKCGKFPEQNMLIQNYNNIKQSNIKDKGQRKTCNCIISKDIGMYNTCRHACVYCYANTSQQIVNKNFYKHSDDAESIITR